MFNINDYFNKKGITNLNRSYKLIMDAIKFNNLDLNGLTIFTEAASGDFIYTPIIAALAGAKMVYAIAADSKYATKESVMEDTLLLAKLYGVEKNISIEFNKNKISEADIITNLGFVRPIDRQTIDNIKSTAVIPYMCEAWEVRAEDVDIPYCKEKGIKVMGTNENYPGLEVFNFSGPLALKMLFDSGIEVYKSKIAIVSNDDFGGIIFKVLSKISDNVTLLKDINSTNLDLLRDIDALIIADYTSKDTFIGKLNGKISGKLLKQLSNFVTVIQFAGIVEINDLIENEINFYPEYQVGRLRMGKTLAYLGPKPIIDLHCAGLKVGEIMFKTPKGVITSELCQDI